MSSIIQKKLSSLASVHEVLTTVQLLDAGISDQSITRLVEQGTLVRVRRGIYQHTNSPVSEQHDLIQVTKSASRAVIVLISALRFHNIGTQQPYQVWIQLPAQRKGFVCTNVCTPRLEDIFVDLLSVVNDWSSLPCR